MDSAKEKRLIIGVIGTSEPDDNLKKLAKEVGREIARKGFILICGGLGGVMKYSAKGAKEKDGLTIGILPGNSPEEANPYIDIAIPTGMGEARNIIIVKTSDVLIAIGKGLGTLSEIAFALRLRKPVIGLSTWELFKEGKEIPAIVLARTPQDAVERAVNPVRKSLTF